MKRNVYLTGMMGVGKTTVGRALAKKLRRPFLDLDLYIERRSGKTIEEIFADQGEGTFRMLESRVLLEVSRDGGRVIALGGGALLKQENREMCSSTGFIVTLTCAEPELWRRIKGDPSLRPLLKGPAPRTALAALVRRRRDTYAHADLTVSTTRRTPEQAAAEIAGRLSALEGRG